MMNLKTAMLGNITRQGVSRQFIPITNSKNQVLTLSQRTAQTGPMPPSNAPTNTMRSFSSSQANRENNNNAPTSSHQFSHFQHTPPFTNQFGGYGSGSFNHSSQRLHGSLGNLAFRKDGTSQSQTSANGHYHSHNHPSSSSTASAAGTNEPPKHTQLSRSAWEAINGHDARAVFPYLQEMHNEGCFADPALSNRIVSQFLELNSPKDAEAALSILVDCHFKFGRAVSSTQKFAYTSLARDIVNHSNSDLTQALSLARLLDRYGLLANSELADGALRTYRQLKSSSGLEALKSKINSSDVEALLFLQATMVRSQVRYKNLIEILLDAKEMNIIPSLESCSRVSATFTKINDYTGQLAWDTAVQEIYPGFKPSTSESHDHETTSSPSTPVSGASSDSKGSSTPWRRYPVNPNAQVGLRTGDPSEAIVRACRLGYAAVALDNIEKMLRQNQLPSPSAIAETIQVCAKREKERSTDYKHLFNLAQRTLDNITDKVHRSYAEYEVYNAMLVANATLGDMTAAKRNYDDIVRLGQFPDATSYATLLIATTTGAVDEAYDALRILDEIKRHNIKPNIFFYNVVIGKLSRGRKLEKVLEVYDEMIKHSIRPNAITYGTLISACTRVGSEEMARNLFTEMVSSPNYNPRHGPHNAMIQFYVRQKKDRTAALSYYDDMLQRGLKPTEHTYTLLIEAFACIQPYDMSEANRLIHKMKRGPIQPTEAHYGALIHAYGVEHRDVSAAETVFQNMLAAGVVPKGPAYQSLIESFITDNQVSMAVQLRDDLLKSGQPSSAYIENTLIRGFGQEGDITAAELIFEAMQDPYSAEAMEKKTKADRAASGAIVKEPSTYQSMVTAYLENGKIDKAFEILARMKSQQYPELVIKPVEESIYTAAAVNAAAAAAMSSHGHGPHHGHSFHPAGNVASA